MAPLSTSNQKLDSMQENIIFLKNYVLLLEMRLVLLKEEYSAKTEYAKNEVNILTYETLAKISATKTKIANLEFKYAVELNEFLYDLQDIADNYDFVLHEAKKKLKENYNLRHYLHSTNWQVINNDITQKISLFKQLKSFLTDIGI